MFVKYLGMREDALIPVIVSILILGTVGLLPEVYAHSTTGQFEDFCDIDNLASGTSHLISINPSSPVAGDAVQITTTGEGGNRVLTVGFKDDVRVLNHLTSIGASFIQQPLDNVFDGTYKIFSCIGTRNDSTGDFFTTHINGPIVFTVVGFPDNDNDGVPLPDDCDDLDPNNFPGNTETPGDQQDNNCNDLIDEFVIEDDPLFIQVLNQIIELFNLIFGINSDITELNERVDSLEERIEELESIPGPPPHAGPNNP